MQDLMHPDHDKSVTFFTENSGAMNLETGQFNRKRISREVFAIALGLLLAAVAAYFLGLPWLSTHLSAPPPAPSGTPSPETPSGEAGSTPLSLEGRVVMESSGEGLPGALVILDLRSTEPIPDHRIVTGSQGEFRFEGLPQGIYRIRAVHERLVSWQPSREVRITADRLPPKVELELGPGIEARGRVIDSRTREPLAGARVVLHQPQIRELLNVYASGHRVTRSLADGTFTIPGLLPEEHEVEVSAPGHVLHQARFTPTGSSRPILEISLDPLGTISGLVTEADGEPASGARIVIDPRSVDPEAWSLFSRTETHTDSEGRFLLGGVPPGHLFQVLILHERHAPARRSSLRLERAGEALHHEIRLERGCVIEGRVLDEQGQPIAGALLRTGSVSCRCWFTAFKDQALRAVETHETTSDDRGRYVFDSLGATCYVVVVTKEGTLDSVESFHLHPGREAPPPRIERDLILRTPKTLRGRVVDESGAPVRQALVMFHGGETRTDENGQFTFGELQELRGILTVWIENRGSWSRELEEPESPVIVRLEGPPSD